MRQVAKFLVRLNASVDLMLTARFRVPPRLPISPLIT